MFRQLSYFFYTLTLIALFCRCGSRDEQGLEGYGMEYPISKDNFDVVDSCMSYMSSNPSKAHHMLDSLLAAKIISPKRCEYLHAIVVLNGDNNADSALCICNRLLDDGTFGDDQFLEEEICDLASNITASRNRYIETLRYANRGIAICHGHEQMRGDETAMMLRVGMAEQMMGRTKQAEETYQKVHLLLSKDCSFSGLISLISLNKKQMELYFDRQDYDKVIATSHDVLALVNRFDRDPSFVDPRPETMNASGEGTHGFADFYRCQMYIRIATAYRQKVQKGILQNTVAETDSVARYIDLLSHIDQSQLLENQVNVLHELSFLGRKAEFDEAKKAAELFYQNDSLVGGYVDYLSLLSEDAARTGNYKLGNEYLRRALVVSDSIRRQDMLRTLSEQISINMVQEHELARQDAENEVSHQRLVIISLSILLVIIVAAAVVIIRLVRSNRKNEQIIETAQQVIDATQQDLNETKEEVLELTQKLEESRNERLSQNTQALYERIKTAMDEHKLYLNADLDIKLLAEEIGSSRTIISVCINSLTGKTFRQWLSEYRLSLFVELLKNHLDDPIEDLMRQCGYKDQSTFRRQFKAMYGMTAGEYRKKLGEVSRLGD